jgi:hypothetical protein
MGGIASSPVTPSVHLTLIPDSSAHAIAGFKSAAPLRLTGLAGESVGLLLDRLNTYRSPEQQIHTIYTKDGKELVKSTVLHADCEAYVRSTSTHTH